MVPEEIIIKLLDRKIKIYNEWINNYQGDIFRKCVEVSNKMLTVFPELKIVKGMVRILDDGCRKEYPHQWLETISGEIVDPTASQWICIMEYRKIDDDNIPIGKCMECGDYVYLKNKKYSPACSSKCLKELEKMF